MCRSVGLPTRSRAPWRESRPATSQPRVAAKASMLTSTWRRPATGCSRACGSPFCEARGQRHVESRIAEGVASSSGAPCPTDGGGMGGPVGQSRAAREVPIWVVGHCRQPGLPSSHYVRSVRSTSPVTGRRVVAAVGMSCCALSARVAIQSRLSALVGGEHGPAAWASR